MIELGFPQEAINGIKDSVDCNLYFFGNSVNILTMYIILISSIIAFIGIYILINVFSGYKKISNQAKRSDSFQRFFLIFKIFLHLFHQRNNMSISTTI